MRSRAFRRHQRERLYNKWLKLAKQWGIGFKRGLPGSGIVDATDRHLWVKRMMENMPICSRPWCCGNIRRMGKLTWQERRARIDEREQRELYV